MNISTKTRYGSRAMYELALAYPDSTISVKEIARMQKLSVKYLEMIIASLKAAGLIQSFRGAEGGYSLARDPREIRMLDIFVALEGSPSPVICIDFPEDCPADICNCPTHDLWVEIGDVVREILDRTTLQDLVDRAAAKQTK